MSDFTVTLVEDSGLIANEINQTVESTGLDVTLMTNRAEEAIQAVRENPPDLVLMDIQLAGEMNGIQATEKISEFSDVPVVYLTAYSNRETVSRAEKTRGVAFLIKPLEQEDLVQIIDWIRSDDGVERPTLNRGEFLVE